MAAALSATPTNGAGTVSLVSGSNVIFGVGTNFTSGQVGNTIIVVGDWNALITAFGSATQVSVSDPPDFTVSGASYQTVSGATYVNITGANADLATSGLAGVSGISSRVVGGQTVYRLGSFRMSIPSGNSLTYNAVNEALAWNSAVYAGELNVAGTITVTGSRTSGTLTRNVHPFAFYFGRLSPTAWNPADSYIVGAGTKNFTGITSDQNGPLSEVSYNVTDCKIRNRTLNANYRMSTGTIINGLEADNANIVLVGVPAALNGLAQYATSSVQWVSLTPTTATTPRKYYNWSMNGGVPSFQSFGTLTYIEQVNYGDFAGASLYMNHGNGFYVRFSRDVTINYKTLAGANVSSFVAYCPDNNNGNRAAPYTADEPMIFSGTNGTGTGNRLIAINRGTSFGTGTTVDIRTPANNTVGDDVFYVFAYGYTPIRLPVNLKGNSTLTSNLTATADSNVTLSASAAAALLGTKFTINASTNTITVLANANYDELYDAVVAFKVSTTEANLKAPTTTDLTKYILTPSGSSLTAFTGWTLVVNSGVTLSAGTKFTFVQFTTVTNNGSITGVYGNSTGVSTILELRDISDKGVVVVANNSTKATELFQTNNTGTDQTYRVYYPPGSAGQAKLVARELYGYQREEEVITLAEGFMWYTFVDIPDVGISETNSTVVAAYSTIENADKLYDRTALFRLTEAGIKLGQIAERDGTNLRVSDYNIVVNQLASSVYSVGVDTITIKALGYANGTKYINTVLDSDKTLTASTNEVISADFEDANGNSAVTILGGDGTFELWKVSTSTATADYATGTKLTSPTVGNEKFRFTGVSGFDIVGVDINSNVRRRTSMAKGVYTQSFYVGDQIQLANAPVVDDINEKVDLMQVDLEAIKGTGFTKDKHSLTNIKKKAALAAALSA